jgi:hypothetical protein
LTVTSILFTPATGELVVMDHRRVNVTPDATALSEQGVELGHDRPENAVLVMALSSSSLACARLTALALK